MNGALRNTITHKHFRLYNDKTKIPEPQFDNELQFESFSTFVASLPASPDLFIIVSKDPYSWLSSYQKWSRKNGWPAADYPYIIEYNLVYSKWRAFSEGTKNILFVRYEDLLLSPRKVINTIAVALKLPERKKIVTTRKVYASRTFSKQKKEAFVNKDHIREFNPNQLHTINGLLDISLLHFLGYQLMELTTDTPTQ